MKQTSTMINFNLVIIAVPTIIIIQGTHGQWKGPKPGSECNWGAVGMCGGYANCPDGSQCKYFGSPRSAGLCCRTKKSACSLEHKCSKRDHCKPGYTCVRGACCRDPVCPKGWIEGDSCNTQQGQAKCQEGYECINNVCCRSTFCPSGSIGPECSKRNPCKPGHSCRGGNCCREPVCQSDWLEGGVCNLKPGVPLCKEGFECNNDFCCKKPDPVSTISDESGPFCLKDEMCRPGYECIAGFCCWIRMPYSKYLWCILEAVTRQRY